MNPSSPPPAPLPLPLPFDFEASYRGYLVGLLTNDRQHCRQCFEQWLEACPELRTLYEDLVRRSLYDVGDLWERGRISVATEHLATAISESLLNLAYPRLFAQPRLGKSAVVACVANEYHQIGGKMVADLFELNGWRGYFLGANTPVQGLLELVTEKHPDVVALSVSVASSLDTLIDAASEVRAAFPDLPILVGGQAFRWGGRERVEHLPGVRCLASLGEAEAWIKQESGR
jgi:methanogenic corrinoid protein MtbC1